MERHKALHSLSHDHHHGLILAQLIKKGSPEYPYLPKTLGGKIEYAISFYNDELVRHFKDEENILFPIVKSRPFYTQAIISPITDDDGKITGYLGIYNDIAEKKMLEKNLIHSQKMENIGILAAGIAHEVGNPLASISALVQVVQRTSSEKFAIEKLELVKSQVKRISKTIRDLVDFSRPSNYELRLTDINKNILDAVEIIKAGIKVKSIEFILKLNSEIPPLSLVQDQIEQVFINILINAIDAIADDNKDLKKIFIYTDIINDNLIITFEDTGIGIYEEDISKIFEPFFTTKEEGKGTGLGLWITYGIIKSFQGDIKVESTKGVGSKFILTLPVNK